MVTRLVESNARAHADHGTVDDLAGALRLVAAELNRRAEPLDRAAATLGISPRAFTDEHGRRPSPILEARDAVLDAIDALDGTR